MLWLITVNPTCNKGIFKKMLRFRVGGGAKDDVEKVERTSGKILATPLLKPKKKTRVLRNVLIIGPGSYF